MREIQLTQGQVALVDDEDYERVNKYKWYTYRNTSGILYAARSLEIGMLRMHSFILNTVKEVDHKDLSGLNNQKENLRFCSKSQNQANTLKRSVNKRTSIYKGVSLNKKTGSWCARLGINYGTIQLGTFKEEIEAALAYDIAALKYFGEFANPNFKAA